MKTNNNINQESYTNTNSNLVNNFNNNSNNFNLRKRVSFGDRTKFLYTFHQKINIKKEKNASSTDLFSKFNNTNFPLILRGQNQKNNLEIINTSNNQNKIKNLVEKIPNKTVYNQKNLRGSFSFTNNNNKSLNLKKNNKNNNLIK